MCKQIIYTGKRAIEVIQVDYPQAIAGRMDVDHIDPVIPVEDSGKDKDWNKIINRLFCEEDNMQSVCSKCHLEKTKKERSERACIRRKNTK